MTTSLQAEALEGARIKRNLEQAAYFEKRTEKLSHTKKIRWETVIPHIIALLSLALALITSCSSVAETRRSREDAAFYKALERIGDKDSPAARASAAQLLAAKAESSDYYETVQSQLLHSLLLESDPVVLGALQDACGRLMRINNAEVSKRLKVVKDKAEVQILEPLAWLTLDGNGEVPNAVTPERWATIMALIPQAELAKDDLVKFIDIRKKTFLSYEASASDAYQAMTKELQSAAIDRARRQFQAAVVRYVLTKQLLEPPSGPMAH